MYPALQTQRLILVPVSMGDEPWIQKYIDDYEIIKFLGAEVPWPYPADGAKTYLRDILKQMKENDIVVWTIRFRVKPDETIGVIEYFFDDRDYNRGFWLASKYQGQGIMSEVVAATQDYILIACGKEKIVDTNAASNAGSQKIKERFGGVKTGERKADYITGEAIQEVWEVTRERWLEAREKLSYKEPEVLLSE